MAATESASRRSLYLALCAVHSFSERPDRNRTPIPESLQWLSTALCPTLTSQALTNLTSQLDTLLYDDSCFSSDDHGNDPARREGRHGGLASIHTYT